MQVTFTPLSLALILTLLGHSPKMENLRSSSAVYDFAGVSNITCKLGAKLSTKTWYKSGRIQQCGSSQLKLGVSQDAFNNVEAVN